MCIRIVYFISQTKKKNYPTYEINLSRDNKRQYVFVDICVEALIPAILYTLMAVSSALHIIKVTHYTCITFIGQINCF